MREKEAFPEISVNDDDKWIISIFQKSLFLFDHKTMMHRTFFLIG